MSYNSELQSNNAELQEILDAVNDLPEAGSGVAPTLRIPLTYAGESDGVLLYTHNSSIAEIAVALNEGRLVQCLVRIDESEDTFILPYIASAGGDALFCAFDGETVIAAVVMDGQAAVITNSVVTPETLELHNTDENAHADIRKMIADLDLGDKVTAENVKSALGYTPMNAGDYAASVKALGAKGDGSTDDTAVFQAALAAHRRVYVPGGTYKLSGGLVIQDNCQMELAQDAVLNFTQTSGNCITVNRSSWLRGNHATIIVPYGFAGNVIYADSSLHTNARDVVPWTHWDPQWKTARYITDINICKFDGNGIHQSKTGDTSGTALYISATGGGTSTFMWGTNISGIRIAGAFEYGIRAVNFNSGWQHEMRLEAFIDSCKIGVSLEDCNKVYFSGSIQPRAAADGTPYAKHGIQLIRSKDTELSGSRVWDWNETNSLWTFDKTNINQHIAMYGDCRGTILNDYNYYHVPSGFSDLRELIYTDTPANYDSLIILQEPFTRWFRPVNGEPHFNNGDGNERLVLKKEQDALFQTDYIPTFDDKLAKATDGNGAVFNEIGYQIGCALLSDGTLKSNNWTTCTGFIPCKANDILYADGMSFGAETSSEARIILYDSSYAKVIHINRENIVSNGSYYQVDEYTETETGFSIKIKNASTAFIRFSVPTSTVSSNPVIAVDEEIAYTQAGFLSDDIHVKEESLTGMGKYERTGRMVNAISAASTDEQYPTAKAVYALVSNALGSYVDAVDALIGGDG